MQPYIFPCIAISPLSSPVDTQTNTPQYKIYTSINAVLYDKTPTNASTQLIAIGPATKAALVAQGHQDITLPSHYSSEGVLALPELSDSNQKHIMIITGVDSKPLLENALTARGAVVSTINVYKRQMPIYTKAMLALITTPHYRFIVTQSLNCLSNLFTLLAPYHTWLLEQQFVVVNNESATYLADAGVSLPAWQADNATDASIIAHIKQHCF